MSSTLRGSGQADARRSRFLPFGFLNRTWLADADDFCATPGTVGVMMRRVRAISPIDKVAFVHDTLLKARGGAACVAFGGKVAGSLTLDLYDRALSDPAWLGIEKLATESLATLLDGPEPVVQLGRTPQLYASDPMAAGRAAFDADPDCPLVAVVNDGGVYMGSLFRSDMVAAELGNLAPARISGMATPLGVYLSDGVVRGGVGNLGLFLTGVAVSVLFVFGMAVVAAGLSFLQFQLHFTVVQQLSRLNPSMAQSAVNDLQTLLALAVAVLLIRLLPIAGYHAAEHQVIHCLERGEPLVADTIRRMPRVHPWCGTNLAVGVCIFSVALISLLLITSSVLEAVVPSLFVTLAFWRSVGSFVQKYIVTRPATPKQLQSGIRAANQLLMKHRECGIETRLGFGARMWNLGILQVILGSYALFGAVALAVQIFPPLSRYVSGL